MGRGFRVKKSVGFLVFSQLVALSTFAQDEVRPVENYQIQSQYGPEVAVLNPVFDKNKTFEFSLGLNGSPTSSLYDYFGISGGAAYHLNRRHSLEFWAQYNVYGETSNFAQTDIVDKCKANASCNSSTLAIDIPKMMLSLAYMFTPYYTKMHITDMSIVHMDINAMLGPAMVMTEEDRFNGSAGDNNWRFGGMVGAGIRVLARSRWGVRLELRDYIHQAKNVGADEIVNDLQMTLGASIFLDSFSDYND